MPFQPFPPPAQQRIGLEKPSDISRAKALAEATPWTAQMFVKVGYVREVGTDCPLTKAMLQQPATETLQKIS